MMDKAIAHSSSELSRDVLVDDICDGEAIMLTANQGSEILGMVIGYRVVFQTGKAVLSCPLTSGVKLELWVDEMMGALKKLARLYNCSALYGTGRSGWGRMLKDYGVKTIHTTYTLELED